MKYFLLHRKNILSHLPLYEKSRERFAQLTTHHLPSSLRRSFKISSSHNPIFLKYASVFPYSSLNNLKNSSIYISHGVTIRISISGKFLCISFKRSFPYFLLKHNSLLYLCQIPLHGAKESQIPRRFCLFPRYSLS